MPRFSSKRDQYVNDLFGKEDRLLASITAGQDDGEFAMQISPYEGKILYLLLKILGARTAIEIGMLAGYSATWIARALGDGGKLYSFERTASAVDLFKQRIKDTDIEKRIDFIGGDAKETLANFNTPVDAVFIDADKSAYLDYLGHAKRLLKGGGLLIADNVFLFGNVYEEPRKEVREGSKAIMQEFNKQIANDPSFEAVIIPTIEGMLVARKL